MLRQFGDFLISEIRKM